MRLREMLWWPLRDLIYDVWRILFGRYDIDDPRLIAKQAPYTFYLPSKERLDLLNLGDEVQIIFRSVPVYSIGGERMWVTIDKIDGESLSGILGNEPQDMPQLKKGTRINFYRWQIIDINWKDREKYKTLPPEPSKQIWDRCMVDQEVLNGTARVGYLYREEPDLGGEDDKYSDSGWRIRADERDITDEEYDNPSPVYIAIGKVLNKDDSWIDLIDAPIGSKFLRNEDTNTFEALEK